VRYNRGVLTEEVLEEMRESDPPISYLVGTPKGRLSKLEAQLFEQPWKDVRPELEVKLLAPDKELYILTQSRQRLGKERAMRRRKLKKLWQRLAQLQQMRLSRDELLIKLGRAFSIKAKTSKLERYRIDCRFSNSIPSKGRGLGSFTLSRCLLLWPQKETWPAGSASSPICAPCAGHCGSRRPSPGMTSSIPGLYPG
jgi:hypothetical protein